MGQAKKISYRVLETIRIAGIGTQSAQEQSKKFSFVSGNNASNYL